MSVILMRNFKNSKFGRDCIAIRTDELAASKLWVYRRFLKKNDCISC